jgi:CBS domain-containing protein
MARRLLELEFMESDEPIIRARDIMVRDIITVTPDTRVLDIHSLFVDEEIHGAPVVDDDGFVHGVVSSLDLLRLVRDELEPGAGATATTYFRDELPYSGPDWLTMPDDLQNRMQELTASDAMTCDIVAVGPDATVEMIAQTMREHHVHRVLVTEDRMLLGLITTFDLLNVLAETTTSEPLAGQTRHTGYSR